MVTGEITRQDSINHVTCHTHNITVDQVDVSERLSALNKHSR